MSVITEIVRDVYHNRNWDNVHNFPEDKLCNHKLFHIQSSVGCLEHIINKKENEPKLRSPGNDKNIFYATKDM